MQNIVTALLLTAMLSAMVMMSTPVSAEQCPSGYHADSTAPYGCMSDPEYTDDDMDLQFEAGYYAGVEDAQCAMSGGVLAEDYSCVPASFYASSVDCTECQTDADYRTAMGESGQI